MRIRPDRDPDPQNTAQSPSDFIPGAVSTKTAAERGTGAAETSASFARQSGHIFQIVLKPVGTGLKPMVFVGYSLSHFVQIPIVLKPVGTGLKPMVFVGYSMSHSPNSPKTSWNRFKIEWLTVILVTFSKFL
jgi:hypothetical protein